MAVTGAAAPPETRTVAIRDLVRDPSFQVRQGTDEGTVLRYANVLAEGLFLPPIKAAMVNGALVLVDGWHRVAAHERRGIKDIEAEVVEATAGEAQWMAAAANLAHGLPLRKAEIRTAFRAMIKAGQHIAKPITGVMLPGSLVSYRDLAKLLGGLVRHNTLIAWMGQDFPRIARRMHGSEAGEGLAASRDDEAVFRNTFTAAIESARANAAGVRDPTSRGGMIEAAEQLVKDLRAARAWAVAEF